MLGSSGLLLIRIQIKKMMVMRQHRRAGKLRGMQRERSPFLGLFEAPC